MASTQVNFRVPDDTAILFRALADEEGGAANLIGSIASAANLTREARKRSGETFTAWLKGYAQLEHNEPDGPPGVEESEAARRAEIEKERAQGFEEGRRAGAEERGSHLDDEWAALDRARAAFVGEQERERAETARQRRDLNDDRRDFEQEAREAQALAQRFAVERAEAEEALRDEGRMDLRAALAIGINGQRSRVVLRAVMESAKALLDEQVQGGRVAPEASLLIASTLVKRVADAMGNPPLTGINVPTSEGTRVCDLHLTSPAAYRIPAMDLLPRLSDIGIVLDSMADDQMLTADQLPEYDGDARLPDPPDLRTRYTAESPALPAHDDPQRVDLSAIPFDKLTREQKRDLRERARGINGPTDDVLREAADVAASRYTGQRPLYRVK